MNAKSPYENTVDASAGAIPEMCTNAAVLLLCAVLVTLVLTASLLLLTLPGTLDAVASPALPVDVDAAYVDERHTGQIVADWVDALSARDLTIWRLRSSD